jgi:hypothetical protein
MLHERIQQYLLPRVFLSRKANSHFGAVELFAGASRLPYTVRCGISVARVRLVTIGQEDLLRLIAQVQPLNVDVEAESGDEAPEPKAAHPAALQRAPSGSRVVMEDVMENFVETEGAVNGSRSLATPQPPSRFARCSLTRRRKAS